MTKETTTMPVAVHKANIPLLRGESLAQFTSNLGSKAKEHAMRKLNIVPYMSGVSNTNATGGGWLVEVFSDKVVMAMYKGSEPNRYHAFKYSRDTKTGNFTFGSLIEVQRETKFVPKEGIAITKGCGGKGAKKTKKEEDVEQQTEKAEWVPASKSLWNGVL